MAQSAFSKLCIMLWKERKYVDAWSVNHFLAGFLLAAVFQVLGAPVLIVAPVAIVLFIFWEFFEVQTDAGEAPSNQVLDVIVDSLGFALGWYLSAQGMVHIGILITLGVVFVVLLAWAYVAKFHFDLDYC